MNVEGLIIAAGLSSRMKSFKMELKLNDKSILERSIENMQDFCSKIYIVGGFEVEKIKKIISKFPNVQLVHNTNYETGMFNSIKEGVRHIEGEMFFYSPGDYPFIQKNTFKKLLDNCNDKKDILVPIYNNTIGPPVLFKKNVYNSILSEPLVSSLRNFLIKTGYKEIQVNDEGILLDIDTMEDYEKAKSYISDL